MDQQVGDYWTVAQVYAGQETRAIENLERQAFSVFCPLITLDVTLRGRVHQQIRPAFPGYLFILLGTTTTWGPINNTHGVLHLLTRRCGADLLPALVPDIVINSLRDRSIDDDRWKSVLEIGTIVRVRRGSLKDHVAVVKMSRDQRLQLMFNFFNREMVIEFLREDVELVDS